MNSTNQKTESERKCCVCDSKIHGRSDKVYCNYKCKNEYHSALRKHAKSVNTQTINNLIKNYKILLLYKGEKTTKFCINKLELIRLGFSFDIVSGVEINKFGLKFQVFEFSFYTTANKNIMVYINNEQSELAPYVYKRWERNLKDKQT